MPISTYNIQSRFDHILELYDLRRHWSYFNLFNTTPFLNSYHGANHVTMLASSIQEFYANHACKVINYNGDDVLLNKSKIRHLMIAAIFHDFNYQGIDFKMDYDANNIKAAVEAYDNFCEIEGEDSNVNTEFIFDLIGKSHYSVHYEGQKPCSGFDHDLFYDCDHSMVLYKNYPDMASMLLRNEADITNVNDMIGITANYLRNLEFKFDFFQKKWEKIKEELIFRMCAPESYEVM